MGYDQYSALGALTNLNFRRLRSLARQRLTTAKKDPGSEAYTSLALKGFHNRSYNPFCSLTVPLFWNNRIPPSIDLGMQRLAYILCLGTGNQVRSPGDRNRPFRVLPNRN